MIHIITKRIKILLILRERGVELYKFYDHEEPLIMIVIFLHLELAKDIFDGCFMMSDIRN
jgi:hypothetical protein